MADDDALYVFRPNLFAKLLAYRLDASMDVAVRLLRTASRIVQRWWPCPQQQIDTRSKRFKHLTGDAIDANAPLLETNCLTGDSTDMNERVKSLYRTP